MTIRPFLHLPPPASLASLSDVAAYLRRMWESLQNTRRGKLECVTEMTFTASAATTNLVDPRLSPQSVVLFDPLTANAAANAAGANMYVLEADRGNGVWTVTHPNQVTTDRKFRVLIIG